MFDFLKKVLTPKPAASPVGVVAEKDLVDVAKVSALVALAAGLQYAAQNLANVDFGVYSPFVTLGLTAVIDFVNKLVKSEG